MDYITDSHPRGLISSLICVGEVVAQIELVVNAALGEMRVINMRMSGRAFASGDAGLFHHVGQHRQREVDAVLHQHLGKG